MKKIRINELARELEVKPGVILDLLPELGVQEKKTHSSSIDEDVALVLRDRLVDSEASLRTGSKTSNGYGHDYGDDFNGGDDTPEITESKTSSEEEFAHVKAAEEPREPERAPRPEARPEDRPAAIRPTFQSPLRPPTAPALGIPPRRPEAPAARPTPSVSASVPGATAQAEPSAVSTESVSVAQASSGGSATEAPARPAEPERSAFKFRPLRPPIGAGSAIQPPLASPAGQSSSANAGTTPIARNVPIPARPLPPPAPRPAASSAPAETAAPGTPIASGPRQPFVTEPQRPSLGVPQRPPLRPATPAVPERPVAPPRPTAPLVPKSPSQGSASRPLQPPTHMITPGGSATLNTPQQASAVPGAPIPPRPTPPRPSAPGLTPGAPIAPRPPGARPTLAGQPAARPVVPPRADILARLAQTQSRPAPAPGAPRPGAPPSRTSPSPGQPIFRGPIRPGQPTMRGPGMPSGPSFPGGPRRPGMRPMHPTTPLRPESATPIPTEQRRMQGKPGGRPTARTRKDQEGILRERVSKRQAIQEPPPIDREITVAEGVTVKELSEKLGVKANLVVKKLVEKKIFATINQTLDVKLAEELAREFGASTNQVSYEEESTQELEVTDESAELVRRAPVVTIMGHVDHGKTSLLDAIRETNIAGREAGGITQHIGAYYIEKNGRKIVFIDTPGHQAFTRMRARGAKVTDIVVLVVSADDGVMPQTLEAIDHAKAAGVPMMVAINKIDKPDAQPDRVKQQLADRGLLAEDWGGDVVMVPVSAKKGQNLDLLLEMILLMADMQDFKANPARPAVGTVLEAQLDKGRGPVATMLVRNGTLRVGDFFICGALFNKVRAMFDDRGNSLREAEPSMPVEVIGLESLPEVGDTFQVVSDTSKAKQIVVYREAKAREVAMAKGARVATLDSLHKQFKEGDLKDLNLIIKADVGGTAEVLSDSLQQLSNEKVRVRVLHSGVGAITESDVLLASASEAIVIGFNVKPERNAQATAEQQKITIRLHSIIYELIDEIKLAMTGLLDPVYKETLLGHAEVREVFKISKVGTVAGCYVADGAIRRDSQIRVVRDGAVIHTAKIEALKRFKNDASEVKNGLECGISLVNFNNINVGDTLEAFTMERVAAELPHK